MASAWAPPPEALLRHTGEEERACSCSYLTRFKTPLKGRLQSLPAGIIDAWVRWGRFVSDVQSKLWLVGHLAFRWIYKEPSRRKHAR